MAAARNKKRPESRGVAPLDTTSQGVALGARAYEKPVEVVPSGAVETCSEAGPMEVARNSSGTSVGGNLGAESPRTSRDSSRRGKRYAAVQDADGELRLFYTRDEVEQILRTTDKAVYAMVERGLLPGVTRIGRRLLFRRAELLDWLRQKSAPSPKGNPR